MVVVARAARLRTAKAESPKFVDFRFHARRWAPCSALTVEQLLRLGVTLQGGGFCWAANVAPTLAASPADGSGALPRLSPAQDGVAGTGKEGAGR